MKHLIYSLIIIFSLYGCGDDPSNVYEGDIKFLFPEEIDDFNEKGFTKVIGDVTIVLVGKSNLSGLKNLNSIDGSLYIKNSNLEDLNGLNNLSFISNGIVITNNKSLNNLSGLNNLSRIGLDLIVGENESLENLNGLEKLTLIERDVRIYNNILLTNYCELQTIAIDEGINGKFQAFENAFNPSIQDIKEGNCSQ